jgi:hypothetical protein
MRFNRPMDMYPIILTFSKLTFIRIFLLCIVDRQICNRLNFYAQGNTSDPSLLDHLIHCGRPCLQSVYAFVLYSILIFLLIPWTRELCPIDSTTFETLKVQHANINQEDIETDHGSCI